MKKVLVTVTSIAMALTLAACENLTTSSSHKSEIGSSNVQHKKPASSSIEDSSSSVESSVSEASNIEQSSTSTPFAQDNSAYDDGGESKSDADAAESTSTDDEGNVHHITMSDQVADGYQLGTDEVTGPDGVTRTYEYTKKIDE